MSDSNNSTGTYTGISGTATGEITVAAVIVIFMLFAVILILYLRAKGYAGIMGSLDSSSHHQVVSGQNQPTKLRHRLDPYILKSLSVTVFRAEEFEGEGGIECAVCVSELRDGEETRLLPKCRHGFHVECIDMWFQSNSTCPLCRNPVDPNTCVEDSWVRVQIEHPEVGSGSGHSEGIQDSFSTLDEGSSSSGGSFTEKRWKRMMQIEIPKRTVEGSLNSPALEKLRTLGRTLSRGSLNSKGYDIEQGVVVGPENRDT